MGRILQLPRSHLRVIISEKYRRDVCLALDHCHQCQKAVICVHREQCFRHVPNGAIILVFAVLEKIYE